MVGRSNFRAEAVFALNRVTRILNETPCLTGTVRPMGKEAVSCRFSCTKWPIFSASEQLAKTWSIGRTFAVTERCLMERCSPSPRSPSPTENAAAFGSPPSWLLAYQGDVSDAVLVARVAEQLALRAGRLERDVCRRDVPLDDVLAQDLDEVEPLRRAESMDRLRVVVDEVRLPAICVSVWWSRRLVPEKMTVVRMETGWTVFIRTTFVSMRKAFPGLVILIVSLGRNHPTRAIQKISFQETCWTKKHVCFS